MIVITMAIIIVILTMIMIVWNQEGQLGGPSAADARVSEECNRSSIEWALDKI